MSLNEVGMLGCHIVPGICPGTKKVFIVMRCYKITVIVLRQDPKSLDKEILPLILQVTIEHEVIR